MVTLRWEALQNFISRNVNIEFTRKSPLTKINIITSKTKMGLMLIENIHSEADHYLRALQKKRITEYIRYLDNQLLSTSNLEQKKSHIETLSNEHKKLGGLI